MEIQTKAVLVSFVYFASLHSSYAKGVRLSGGEENRIETQKLRMKFLDIL